MKKEKKLMSLSEHRSLSLSQSNLYYCAGTVFSSSNLSVHSFCFNLRSQVLPKSDGHICQLSPQTCGETLVLISQAIARTKLRSNDALLEKWFVITEVKSTLTRETGLKNTGLPLSLHHCVSIISTHLLSSCPFLCLVFEPRPLCFLGLSEKKKRRKENECIGFACRRILPF